MGWIAPDHETDFFSSFPCLTYTYSQSGRCQFFQVQAGLIQLLCTASHDPRSFPSLAAFRLSRPPSLDVHCQ